MKKEEEEEAEEIGLLELLQSQDVIDEPCGEQITTEQFDPQINVVLGPRSGMASEFHITFDTYSTQALFNSGASHSCMSAEVFKDAGFPKLESNIHVSIRTAVFQLGKSEYKHTFIVCENLTSPIILGLDFASKHKIGSDWTDTGQMYLHQGQHKIAVSNTSKKQQPPCRLVLKTHVTLPPGSTCLVPTRVKGQN